MRVQIPYAERFRFCPVIIGVISLFIQANHKKK